MEQRENAGPATSWAGLSDMYGQSIVEALGRDREQIDALRTRDSNRLSWLLLGKDAVVVQSIAMLGNIDEELFGAWREELPRAISGLKQRGHENRVGGFRILSLALVLETTGFSRPDGVDDGWLKSLLTSAEDFSDQERRSLAFAALAMQRSDTALEFILADPIADPSPGQLFEFNTFDLIRYLAAAITDGLSAESVHPAWEEHVRLFPLNLAASASDWPDLLHASHALALMDGREPRTAADWLRKQVAQFL